ncbi:THUMP domain-containing protein [Stygiolobus caldivivus]|uniref:RNA methyltransferase n=1 Tax=Stygiolobus caldivivus TaxID=2824673 RepID=A0A8D5U6L3_9CREN|nr:THUMP domain-containing protein [Stygiolobus caldivivus]BCU70496.1 RNA methyltransferase [Stygiolobus caldivivus]
MKPVLLVTARKNKENRCTIEILNRILIKDINAKVDEIIKNVFIVYSDLNPMEAFGLLYSASPSCVSKIYPINFLLYSTKEDEIIKNVVDYSRQIVSSTFYVDCFKRGVEVSCREIEIGIGLGLKGYAKVDFKHPDIIITVNVLPNFTTVSYLKKVK